MSKIFIQKLGSEQSVKFELDSGLEVVAEIIVTAHVEDFGVGAYECHGATGTHVDLGWVIDEIEIIRADIYCYDLYDFARLQETCFPLLKNIMEPKIQITLDPRGEDEN